MKKSIQLKFAGKTNNIASVSLAAGKYLGQKLSDDYTTLFRVVDLNSAKVKSSVSSADWSPMIEPTEKNMKLLTDSVDNASKIVLTDVLNEDTEVNDTIAVPDAFLKFPVGRNFYYDVNDKGRANVNLSEVTTDNVEDWKKGVLQA